MSEMSNDPIDAARQALDYGEVLGEAAGNLSVVVTELRAENTRLRERDAAWEWLARLIGDSMKFKAVGVMDNMDGCAEISQVRLDLPQGEPFDSLGWTHQKSVASPKGEPPDPVALADKLDPKWRDAK